MADPRKQIDGVRHCVDLHTRDIICPRLVWDHFAFHATAETFSQCMAELTPALQSYFHDVVLALKPVDQADQRALAWLADYYASNPYPYADASADSGS
jgi:hypothetical protein